MKKKYKSKSQLFRLSKKNIWDKRINRLSVILGIIIASITIINLIIPFPEKENATYSIEIKGKVRDRLTSNSIKGALISVDAEQFSAKTNSDGEFFGMLQNIPKGKSICIRVSHKEYNSDFKERLVQSSGPIEIEFYLTRSIF